LPGLARAGVTAASVGVEDGWAAELTATLVEVAGAVETTVTVLGVGTAEVACPVEMLELAGPAELATRVLEEFGTIEVFDPADPVELVVLGMVRVIGVVKTC
jgi:hypothetical protein